MKVVYACENCKSTYLASAGKTGDCPKCGGELIEFDITESEWRTMSDDERNSILYPQDEDFESMDEDEFAPTENTEEISAVSKIAGIGGKIARSGGKALVNKFKEKKLGAIVIDESNHRFRIEGGEALKAKKDGVATKLVKGTLAVSTVGLSVLAEKGAKAGANAVKSLQWYDFDELIGYTIQKDNKREYQSNSTRVHLAKGISVGSSRGTSKVVTQSMDIIVSLDDIKTPSVRIPIITHPLSGSAFDNAVKYGEETARGIDYIKSHR